MKIKLIITLEHEGDSFIVNRDMERDPANAVMTPELREYLDLTTHAMNLVDDEWEKRVRETRGLRRDE